MAELVTARSAANLVVVEDSLASGLSPRLRAIVNSLPLECGMQVLEVGCDPGAAAREIASRVGNGHVLGIDRSAKAIEQATRASQADLAAGRLSYRCVAIEDFELQPGEAPYDLAIAVRVGALDGRHPEAGEEARARIASALIPRGRLFIDGGDPLVEVSLHGCPQETLCGTSLGGAQMLGGSRVCPSTGLFGPT